MRLAAVWLFLLTGAAFSHAATGAGSFSVGITIGHPGTKIYRGAVSHFVPVYPGASRRYTCAAAEIGLRRKGFRSINRLDCRGSIYRYTARRLGHPVVVKVSSHSGRILAVRY
jgi:hypothetical protein